MKLSILISYDEWANRKVFEVIKNLPENKPYGEIYSLFAHLLAAQVIWMSRITGSSTSGLKIWPELSLSEIESLLGQNPRKLKELVSDPSKIIRYSNSKGDEFQNSVEEILMHLIIHGQHHRAQIAKLLRQAGITPPGTDFIIFLRVSQKYL